MGSSKKKETIKAVILGLGVVLFCVFSIKACSSYEEKRMAFFNNEIPINCYANIQTKLELLKKINAEAQFKSSLQNAVNKDGYVSLKKYTEIMGDDCSVGGYIGENEDILKKEYMEVKKQVLEEANR